MTAADPGGLSAPKRALLDLLLAAERAGNGVAAHGIRRRRQQSPAPQSFAQRRLWLLEALSPGTPMFTVRTAIRLPAAVDHGVLTRSVNEVVRRHESLRTTFTEQDGRPIQVVAARLDVELAVIEIDGPTAADRERAAWRYADQQAARPFDLATGPLIRGCVLRLGTESQILLLTLHHIVADGWSLGILLRELTAIHDAFARGAPSPLPEPAVQYADYAIWQQAAVAAGSLRGHLEYWIDQLAGVPPLMLPTVRPRPTTPGVAGERQHLILSREVTEGLTALSHREGATLFMTLQAALQTVLGRWSGQEDFGIGTPIANRTRVETEQVIGFFLNTLVLRADLRGDPTFVELLGRVRDTTMAAYAHQEVPFELLLEALRPPRDPGRTPLFQVFFNLLNFADDRLNRPVLLPDAPPAPDTAQFDLTLYAGEHESRLQLQLVHRTDLFDTATAGTFLRYLATLLGEVVHNPHRRLSALPIVSAEQRGELVQRRNRVRPDTAFEPFADEAIEQSVAARFAEQVARHPHRVAVRSAGTGWTYRELDSRVERIAAALLQAKPGGPGRVAVLCAHDAPMVAAVLGVLRAGDAYVPLDRGHPIDRLHAVVEDAQASVLLCDRSNLDVGRSLAAGLPVLELETLLGADDLAVPGAVGGRPDDGPDSLAYLLYTSGSTGRPKGVVQNHRNLLHHIRAYTNALHICADDRLSLLASVGFDAALMDIYGALLNGATLCIFDVRRNGLLPVPRWLSDEQVTIYHSTPTVFRAVFDPAADPMPSSLRVVVVGGEEATRLDIQVFRRLAPPGCLFVNGLGPTESTLALQYLMDRGTQLDRWTVPVGFPVQDTSVLLLNESGEEVDVYGVGTIAVRSRFVAREYWRRPELTRAAFRPAPLLPGVRVYDTGDLGRLLPDGAIEYAGRRDRQLKIRGQRVEIGEVEALLMQHAGVRSAFVTGVEHPTRATVLVAYVVPRADPVPTADVQAFLRGRLPEHMVPAAVVAVPELPMTVNGKVDRDRLPIPDLSSPPAAAVVAPRTELERTLAALVAAVLGRSQVGVTDDFFELGGHSLLATQLLSRVRTAFGIELPLRAVFEHPTVAGLVGVLEDLRQDGSAASTAIPALPRFHRPT